MARSSDRKIAPLRKNAVTQGIPDLEPTGFLVGLTDDLLNTIWLHKEITQEEYNKKVNSAIEMLGKIAPQDGVETILAVQMIATHNAAIECLRRALIPDQIFDAKNSALKNAEKFLKLYLEQLRALDRRRGMGDQKIVVKHVTVESGAQAIVGHVSKDTKR